MGDGQPTGAAGGRNAGRPASEAVETTNKRVLARRFFLQPGYGFRPASVHDPRFHKAKVQYPYLGYVDVEVEDVPPFVMFSNNDDQVAQIYFWFGPDTFESLSLRLWRELARSSEHILDIGAFTGVYSLVAARTNLAAKVYSFEPMKRTFGRMITNLQANRLWRRVAAFDVALSDEDGRAEMSTFRGHLSMDSGSSLISNRDEEVASRELVETRRLDTFIEEADIGGMDLMKLDVERAERMVVDGMMGALRRHRPHLIIEVFSAENLGNLSETLSSLGYSFAVIDDEAQSFHVDDAGAHRVACNVLFAPIPPDELRDFCRTVKPLPPAHFTEDLKRRYRRPDYRTAIRRLRRRLRGAEEREQRLRSELEAMRASRGWKVARALSTAAARARRTLKKDG